MTVPTLLFFPFDILAEGTERISDREGRSREERDILVISFGEEERDRRQADHGRFPPAHGERPDDRDDAPVSDPAGAADDEVAAPLRLTHSEHLSPILG